MALLSAAAGMTIVDIVRAEWSTGHASQPDSSARPTGEQRESGPPVKSRVVEFALLAKMAISFVVRPLASSHQLAGRISNGWPVASVVGGWLASG